MTFVAIDIGTCFEVSGIEDVGVGGSRRQGNEVNLRRFFCSPPKRWQSGVVALAITRGRAIYS